MPLLYEAFTTSCLVAPQSSQRRPRSHDFLADWRIGSLSAVVDTGGSIDV